jgi:hypothetical protein
MKTNLKQTLADRHILLEEERSKQPHFKNEEVLTEKFLFKNCDGFHALNPQQAKILGRAFYAARKELKQLQMVFLAEEFNHELTQTVASKQYKLVTDLRTKLNQKQEEFDKDKANLANAKTKLAVYCI